MTPPPSLTVTITPRGESVDGRWQIISQVFHFELRSGRLTVRRHVIATRANRENQPGPRRTTAGVANPFPIPDVRTGW